eukprot:6194809-Pleurochrysis_carterae.AAC.1
MQHTHITTKPTSAIPSPSPFAPLPAATLLHTTDTPLLLPGTARQQTDWRFKKLCEAQRDD